MTGLYSVDDTVTTKLYNTSDIVMTERYYSSDNETINDIAMTKQ